MHGEDYVALGFLFGNNCKVAYVSDVSRFPLTTEVGELSFSFYCTCFYLGEHTYAICDLQCKIKSNGMWYIIWYYCAYRSQRRTSKIMTCIMNLEVDCLFPCLGSLVSSLCVCVWLVFFWGCAWTGLLSGPCGNLGEWSSLLYLILPLGPLHFAFCTE